MISPTTWATWSAAWSRWCTATGRGRCPGPGRRRGSPPGPRLTGAHWRRHATRFRNAIAAGLADFDFRAATAAIWEVVDEANRYVERAEPWRLARAERDGDAAAGELLDESLALLVGTCARAGPGAGPVPARPRGPDPGGLRRLGRAAARGRAGVPPP